MLETIWKWLTISLVCNSLYCSQGLTRMAGHHPLFTFPFHPYIHIGAHHTHTHTHTHGTHTYMLPFQDNFSMVSTWAFLLRWQPVLTSDHLLQAITNISLHWGFLHPVLMAVFITIDVYVSRGTLTECLPGCQTQWLESYVHSVVTRVLCWQLLLWHLLCR